MLLSMRHHPLVVGLGLALLSLAPLAGAVTSPVKGTEQATAAVANSCVVVSADSLALGAYSPVSGLAASGSGQIVLRCTKGTAFTVSPTSGGALLRGTGGNLSYGLYVDASMTQQWGQSNPAKYVVYDTSIKYAGSGNSVAVFGTVLTAAQFSANSLYATQPYAIYNNNGTLSYAVNYLAQPTTSAQLSSIAQANPGSTGYSISNFVVSNTPLTPGPGSINFIVPTSTSKSGTAYQVPTGFSGTASLTGTSTSGLSSKAVTYYGKVPANQDMTPGTYTDTVVFTVIF